MVKTKKRRNAPAESTEALAGSDAAAGAVVRKMKKTKFRSAPESAEAEEVIESKKKKNKLNASAEAAVVPAQADTEEAAARAAREEAVRKRKEEDAKRKAANRALRERFEANPSSLNDEEQARAKALLKVWRATEAARAVQHEAGDEGLESSNEKKRKMQAEIAEVRKSKKLEKKQSLGSSRRQEDFEEASAVRAAATGQHGRGRGGGGGQLGRGRGGAAGTHEGSASAPDGGSSSQGLGRGSSDAGGRGRGRSSTESSVRTRPQKADISVQRAENWPQKAEKAEPSNRQSNDATTVMVAGLLKNTKVEKLRATFHEVFGEVEAVRMVKNKEDGSFKGIAFVVFKDESGFTKALRFNGKPYEGQPIIVKRAR